MPNGLIDATFGTEDAETVFYAEVTDVKSVSREETFYSHAVVGWPLSPMAHTGNDSYVASDVWADGSSAWASLSSDRLAAEAPAFEQLG